MALLPYGKETALSRLKRINALFFLTLFLASALSVLFFLLFASNHEHLLYRDAKSHLNIARRVFFSQTPGLAQLGGTWLPIPHILMLPFVWITPLYYSGIAGAIPAMASFIILVIATYLSIYEVAKDRWAAFIGSVVLMTNSSLLYLQTTPMSELPLFAFTGLSYLFLIRWVVREDVTELIRAALFICIATLTRYDAWFIFVSEAAIVALISIIKRSKYKKLESNFLLFVVLGGFGIFLWLIYNNLIFGNPLNFALGQGSGSWDANRVSTLSNNSAKFNLPLSIQIFSWMTFDNLGIVILGTLILSLIYLVVTKKISLSIKVGTLIFLSPFIFNIVALFLGQSVAFSKHVYPFETYNLRYGTALLPAAAFFIGLLAWSNKYIKGLILAGIIFQLCIYISQPLVIIEDAKVGNAQAEVDVARWVKNHPVSGKTLLSTLAHDPLLFEARIPMGQLIYEGNQDLWRNALKSPDFFVDRIIMKSSDSINDQVRKALYKKPVLKEKYNLVYDHDGYQVYDKKQDN